MTPYSVSKDSDRKDEIQFLRVRNDFLIFNPIVTVFSRTSAAKNQSANFVIEWAQKETDLALSLTFL